MLDRILYPSAAKPFVHPFMSEAHHKHNETNETTRQRTMVDFKVAEGVGLGVEDVEELGNGSHGVDGEEDDNLQCNGRKWMMMWKGNA